MTEATLTRQLLTVLDAATILHLSRSAAYLLVQSGQLASVRIGRSVRIRPEILEAFISAHETGASA